MTAAIKLSAADLDLIRRLLAERDLRAQAARLPVRARSALREMSAARARRLIARLEFPRRASTQEGKKK